jgi:hypothetical protein
LTLKKAKEAAIRQPMPSAKISRRRLAAGDSAFRSSVTRMCSPCLKVLASARKPAAAMKYPA